MDSFVIAGSVWRAQICQNLTDLSWDDEMMEEGEENMRDVMSSVCPIKVLMG